MRRAAIAGSTLVSLGLVAWATIHGPGVSNDSAAYAYAAHSFASHGTLNNISGGALTVFPPGMPVLLAALHAMGLSIDAAARLVDLSCLAATVPLVYLLAIEAVGSAFFALIVAAGVALLNGTFIVFTMLWSEPVFVALTLCALYLVLRAIRQRVLGWRSVAAITVSVSLATTVRYIGVLLVPVVLVGALTVCRHDLLRVVTATGGSAAGFVLVASRNLAHGVGVMGPRATSSESLRSVIKASVSTLGNWVLPEHAQAYYLSFGVLFGALAGVGIAVAIWNRNWALVILGVFAMLYWLALWYSEVTTPVDAVDARLTAPVFPAMVILAGYPVLAAVRGVPAWHVGALVSTGFAGLVLVSVVHSGKMARQDAMSGIGFNKPVLLHSRFAAAVRALPSGMTVASNDPGFLMWLSGKGPVVQIPASTIYSPPAVTRADMSRLEAAAARGPVDLAYLTSPGADPAFDPSRLPVSCEQPARYDAGAIYRCS